MRCQGIDVRIEMECIEMLYRDVGEQDAVDERVVISLLFEGGLRCVLVNGIPT